MKRQWRVGAAAIVLLFALQTVGHGQTTDAQSNLITKLRERFDVVALQQGVALVPRDSTSPVRMIQVVDGVVTVDGETLTGQQLRDRLGADADLVLQVTYLGQQQQRELAGAGPAAPATAAAAPPPAEVQRTDVIRGDRVQVFGGDVTIERNQRLEGDAVAVGGSVTVNGEVSGDAVSIGGTLTLGPDSVVHGDAVSVGGTLNRAPGARVDGDVTEVGGGARGFRRGMWFPAFFGTFWSRVGSLAATALRLAVLALVAVIIVAFGRNAVERIAARTAATPLRSGLIGLVAEILFFPVMILTVVVLAVSIIGIPLLFLVPFAVLLVMLVALVGFVGLAYHVGRWIAAKFGWREPAAYGAVAIGVVAIGGLTLLAKLAALGGGFIVGAPLTGLGYLVEYVAWTVGFGAAILYWYESQTRFGLHRHVPATPTPGSEGNL
jgi:hypothetical protein